MYQEEKVLTLPALNWRESSKPRQSSDLFLGPNLGSASQHLVFPGTLNPTRLERGRKASAAEDEMAAWTVLGP